jgi:hypothetical protein
MRRVAASALLALLTMLLPASHPLWGDDRPERIWILPFTQPHPDPALEYFQDAFPALLAVAVSGSGDGHSVVERDALNAVLNEQSLTLEDLTSPEARQRVGKLLGATIMVAGSFRSESGQLHVTVRASDLEAGIVVAAADGSGPMNQPGALVRDLYRRLAGTLGRRLPELAPGQVDDAPLSNLHFMKGLGHYFSARYSQSLAEFMLAAEDKRMTDISRLWMANAYLAQHQYSHACLELMRLRDNASKGVPPRDVAAGIRECEQHLSGDDMKVIREMAGRQDRAAR